MYKVASCICVSIDGYRKFSPNFKIVCDALCERKSKKGRTFLQASLKQVFLHKIVMFWCVKISENVVKPKIDLEWNGIPF